MRPPWASRKPFGLNEHTAGPAARIADPALDAASCIRKWLQRFDQHSNYGTGRVELAAALALRPGEAAEEIFIHAA